MPDQCKVDVDEVHWVQFAGPVAFLVAMASVPLLYRAALRALPQWRRRKAVPVPVYSAVPPSEGLVLDCRRWNWPLEQEGRLELFRAEYAPPRCESSRLYADLASDWARDILDQVRAWGGRDAMDATTLAQLTNLMVPLLRQAHAARHAVVALTGEEESRWGRVRTWLLVLADGRFVGARWLLVGPAKVSKFNSDSLGIDLGTGTLVGSVIPHPSDLGPAGLYGTLVERPAGGTLEMSRELAFPVLGGEPPRASRLWLRQRPLLLAVWLSFAALALVGTALAGPDLYVSRAADGSASATTSPFSRAAFAVFGLITLSLLWIFLPLCHQATFVSPRPRHELDLMRVFLGAAAFASFIVGSVFQSPLNDGIGVLASEGIVCGSGAGSQSPCAGVDGYSAYCALVIEGCDAICVHASSGSAQDLLDSKTGLFAAYALLMLAFACPILVFALVLPEGTRFGSMSAAAVKAASSASSVADVAAFVAQARSLPSASPPVPDSDCGVVYLHEDELGEEGVVLARPSPVTAQRLGAAATYGPWMCWWPRSGGREGEQRLEALCAAFQRSQQRIDAIRARNPYANLPLRLGALASRTAEARLTPSVSVAWLLFIVASLPATLVAWALAVVYSLLLHLASLLGGWSAQARRAAWDSQPRLCALRADADEALLAGLQAWASAHGLEPPRRRCCVRGDVAFEVYTMARPPL